MPILSGRLNIKKLQSIMVQGEVDVWALDEVHFQKHGSRCRMWIPPEEKNPILFHHPTRKSVGYFGAVRLRDGKFIYAREANSFNARTTFDFFRRLLEVATISGRKIVVILDNARYHHAKLHKGWREEHVDQIVFEYLPPYSPELNPSERIWKLTRRLCLHNRYLPLLNNVTRSVEAQFDKWVEPNEDLRRLCVI